MVTSKNLKQALVIDISIPIDKNTGRNTGKRTREDVGSENKNVPVVIGALKAMTVELGKRLQGTTSEPRRA